MPTKANDRSRKTQVRGAMISQPSLMASQASRLVKRTCRSNAPAAQTQLPVERTCRSNAPAERPCLCQHMHRAKLPGSTTRSNPETACEAAMAAMPYPDPSVTNAGQIPQSIQGHQWCFVVSASVVLSLSAHQMVLQMSMLVNPEAMASAC